MSYDLKLVNGDVVLNSTGDVQTVSNDAKLIQDVLKILFTATGENTLHKWYGTPLLSRVVGQSYDLDLLQAEIQSAIEYGINNLITLQSLQLRDNQFVTPKELIASIDDISAELDQVDKRKLAITVKIRAKSNETVSETFVISV